MNYVKTIWALLPPVIAIIFALKTKEVYISLLIGIVSGTLLLTNFHLVESLNLLFDTVVNCLSKPSNIGILIFLVMLGIIVTLMTKSGGSQAYGKWAKKKMKSSKQSLFSTFILGVVIFVDDYFNCLTVGSVMREITDEFKVSRAMLAYIIDSTAAPICIIAPISSWAAAVSGYTSGDGFQLFLNTIPFNLYALLTIVMVCYVIGGEFHLGKMKKHELAAQNGDVHFGDDSYQTNEEISYNQKGKVLDLILPVIVLIMSCIIGMIYTGGFFDGKDLITAFSQCDASRGLVYGTFVTLIFVFILYIPRKIISYNEFVECIPEGFKAMVPAILILTFAWTLKGMTDSLGAKEYVAGLVGGISGPWLALFPAVVFVVGAFLAFATGTSWGTFGILIPIVVSTFSGTNHTMMIISISACMAGAVCGDHCSPISDTTIMASAGAQCSHINHVSTQLPYVLVVVVVSCITYIIAGFVQSPVLPLIIGIVLMVGTLFGIKYLMKNIGVRDKKDKVQ